ncbi:MAG: Hsp20/alpha crystallin family protein [Acidobacteriota bacterium]
MGATDAQETVDKLKDMVWFYLQELARDTRRPSPEDLLIKAQTGHNHKHEEGTVHNCEFVSGHLFRSIRLPRMVNPDSAKAECRNGMLIVRIDKATDGLRATLN